MSINPFKNSDLNDLQENIKIFFSDRFSGISYRIKEWRINIVRIGKERLTVMFIPHSEKRIINFHISLFAIFSILGIFIITVVITSFFIIDHSSTIKEVSKLKKYGSSSKNQMKKYKEEINKLYAVFQKFKPELTHLYSLIPNSNIETVWAKGGIHNPNPAYNKSDSYPPLEILNMEEVKNEIKTTKKILLEIKKFLVYRKKIIENTPSVWPVNGFIISKFGLRNSPYTFKNEFHQGIDINAFPGTEIRAAAPGKVSDIRWDSALGLTISIKHKYGFVTMYSHCQRASVEIGQKI